MPTRAVPYLKIVAHLLLLWPALGFWYWYHTGGLSKDADPVNTLTHATGNWALWILLASLAITPLRRLHPKLGILVRFRRLVGLYAFFYASLHLATYIFLYSGYDVPAALAGLRAGHAGALVTQWKAVWPSMRDDLLKRRFIQIGLFSWLTLLALTLTSPQRVLRRIGGKNWQRLHRLVYAAAAAACLHYWWIVKSGVRAPLPDTLVLTAVLLARLGWLLWKRHRPVPAMRARATA